MTSLLMVGSLTIRLSYQVLFDDDLSCSYLYFVVCKRYYFDDFY
jgi:hypothetical protein